MWNRMAELGRTRLPVYGLLLGLVTASSGCATAPQARPVPFFRGGPAAQKPRTPSAVVGVGGDPVRRVGRSGTTADVGYNPVSARVGRSAPSRPAGRSSEAQEIVSYNRRPRRAAGIESHVPSRVGYSRATSNVGQGGSTRGRVAVGSPR